MRRGVAVLSGSVAAADGPDEGEGLLVARRAPVESARSLSSETISNRWSTFARDSDPINLKQLSILRQNRNLHHSDDGSGSSYIPAEHVRQDLALRRTIEAMPI